MALFMAEALIVIFVFSLFFAPFLAHKKGRNWLGFLALAALVGPLAFFTLAVPRTKRGRCVEDWYGQPLEAPQSVWSLPAIAKNQQPQGPAA